MTHFRSLQFENYKGLRDVEVPCGPGLNILVGKNNAGKSTTLSPFRMLPSTLRSASSRRASKVGRRLGWTIKEDGLPVSLENVHTDLEEVDTRVVLDLRNGAQLRLEFPAVGGAMMTATPEKGSLTTPTAFRKNFPLQLHVCPVLGPVEHDEVLLTPETVKRGWGTHRASRHFRNTWHHFPDGFERFARLLEETWEDVRIGPPERSVTLDGVFLHMFIEERRRPRELYWCGFGLQIWCQLLTWASRVPEGGIFVVDEPETYLHPMLQRRFLEVLRYLGAQVFMATHSASIIASARQGEVLVVDREAGTVHPPEKSGLALAQELGMLPS